MCPGPRKQPPTSSPIVSTSPKFFWIFCYFIVILHLKKRTFPNLDMPPGPWKQPPTSSSTVSTTSDFAWFFCYFSAILWIQVQYTETHISWGYICHFRLFICIYLHLASFQNDPTIKECKLQKKTMSFGPDLAELHIKLHFHKDRLLIIQHVQKLLPCMQ